MTLKFNAKPSPPPFTVSSPTGSGRRAFPRAINRILQGSTLRVAHCRAQAWCSNAAVMSKRLALQPLPKRLSETTDARADAATAAKPARRAPSALTRKDAIEPRRLALKYAAQTLVLEYKEPATGKLRHRSFRIDVDRFETSTQCERRLWGRISKAIVPGSLQPEQVGKLVAQLFQHEKQHNPGDNELSTAADRFMSEQISVSTPTRARTGLKPMPASPSPAKPTPLADSQAVKPNLALHEASTERKGLGGVDAATVAEGDKENSPAPSDGMPQGLEAVSAGANADVSRDTAASIADTRVASVKATAHETEPGATQEDSANTGAHPLPDAAKASSSSSLLGDLPKLAGTLGAGGGTIYGRRAGLVQSVRAGGFDGADIAGPAGDNSDDDRPPLFSSQEVRQQADETEKAEDAEEETEPAPAHSNLEVETPESPTSSQGEAFLGVGTKSPDLDEELVEEEDIPDYADDFEDDDFEDEDDDLPLPLPGSNAKDKVGGEERTANSEAAEETAAAREERLRLRGDDVDLQHVEQSELDRYKAAMEAEFEQNAIKPGDANWVHDVQVDFGDAEEDCGWDEEDEEVVDDDDAF